MIPKVPAGEVISLLRVFRHDYLNHLQVVMGFLQLNKPERALEHVRQAIEESERGAGVTRLAFPGLALWLLLRAAAERRRGMPVGLLVGTDLRDSMEEEETLVSAFEQAWPAITLATRGLTLRLEEDKENYRAGFFPGDAQGEAVLPPDGWQPGAGFGRTVEKDGFWLTFPRRAGGG